VTERRRAFKRLRGFWYRHYTRAEVFRLKQDYRMSIEQAARKEGPTYFEELLTALEYRGVSVELC